MSLSDREVIALQSWWMGELSAITQRVMKEEEKRQNRERAAIDKKLGEYQTKLDIQEAYGVGAITEKKMDKLMDRWEQRESVTYSNRLHEEKLAMLSDLYRTAKQIINEKTEYLNRK